ncbi:MAG TPA: hypothetical protein VFN76_10020 [Candidatus Limnocylindria bacterium]|nr:hypothetical protein [Candidatus Limnocylindria bacterium]
MTYYRGQGQYWANGVDLAALGFVGGAGEGFLDGVDRQWSTIALPQRVGLVPVRALPGIGLRPLTVHGVIEALPGLTLERTAAQLKAFLSAEMIELVSAYNTAVAFYTKPPTVVISPPVYQFDQLVHEATLSFECFDPLCYARQTTHVVLDVASGLSVMDLPVGGAPCFVNFRWWGSTTSFTIDILSAGGDAMLTLPTNVSTGANDSSYLDSVEGRLITSINGGPVVDASNDVADDHDFPLYLDPRWCDGRLGAGVVRARVTGLNAGSGVEAFYRKADY